jgi:hypothetical protein
MGRKRKKKICGIGLGRDLSLGSPEWQPSVINTSPHTHTSIIIKKEVDIPYIIIAPLS